MCRRKKLRCFIEGDERVCTLCRLQGIECTFVEQPVKRVRTSVKSAFSPPPHSAQQDSNTSPQWSRMCLFDGKVADFRSDDARSKSISSPTKPAPRPSAADGSLTMYNGHTTQWVGPSGDLDPALLKARPNTEGMDVLAETSIRHISSDPNDPIHFNVVPDMDSETEPQPPSQFTFESLREHCQPYTRRMIDLYFRSVHPTYPIINQTRFTRFYEEGNLAATPGTLLASVLVLASNWWSFDAALSRHQCPDMKPLRDYLRQALLTEMKTPRLVTIQSVLLYFSSTMTASQKNPVASSSELWALTGSVMNLPDRADYSWSQLRRRWDYIKVRCIGLFPNGKSEYAKGSGGQCSFTTNGMSG